MTNARISPVVAIQGRRDAQAYLDDVRHQSEALVRPTTRQVMDDHFARVRLDALAVARECFLSMIADADRWEEDVDGDCDGEGRPVMYVDYDLRVGHSQLRELCDALNIEATGYDETLKEAIDRAVTEPRYGDSPPAVTPIGFGSTPDCVTIA